MTLGRADVTVIGDIVSANAARYPDREAVVDGGRRLTWAELDDRVVRIANGLRAGLGLGQREPVSVLADNSLEYYELFHATAMAGVIMAPLNQRLAPAELEAIVEKIEPRVIFHSPGYEEQAIELAKGANASAVAIGRDGPGSYYELLSSGSSSRDAYRPSPEDPATICFTGGTTGLPKGAVIGHRSLAACGPRTIDYQGLVGFDRHLFVRPMAVAPGHRMVAQHGFSVGTTIITTRFEPELFLRTVEAEGATTSLLSQTMFSMLFDANVGEHDVSSLRSFLYGGAPSTPDLISRVLETFPSVDLHHVYGGTEAAVALHLGPDDHQAGRLDSVGRPLSGVDVRLVNDSGKEVPAGEPGELLVCSDEIFTEYWRDPEATAAVRQDGFYWTGDIGVIDDEGYVRLVGRRQELIISGGFNVYPIEVENVLATHPAVKEVAVIGVPHSRWGETVHAVVVSEKHSPISETELVQYCSGRIASYKKPTSVEFVNDLPRTSVGKVAKQVLRDRSGKE